MNLITKINRLIEGVVTDAKAYVSKLIYVSIVLLLTACGAGGSPECIEADNFGDFNIKDIIVDAKGSRDGNNALRDNGWFDTGLRIEKSSDIVDANLLTVDVKHGQVQLCSEDVVYLTGMYNNNNGGKIWQDTGIDLQDGGVFKIEIEGDWNRYPIGHASQNVWFANGKEIFAFIGGAAPANNYSGVAGKTNDADPEYFDLEGGLNIGMNNPDGSYTANEAAHLEAIGGGRLYIKYADVVNLFSDNRERNNHRIKVTYWGTTGCLGEKGQYLLGYIGNTPPSDANLNLSSDDIINIDDDYQGNTSSNPPIKGGYYQDVAPKSGKLWLKVIDKTGITWASGEQAADNNYDKNNGSYAVQVSAPKDIKGPFYNMINEVVAPLKLYLLGGVSFDSDGNAVIISGVTERFYKGVVASNDFINGIRAAVALSIVFFAFSFMMGLSDIKQKEFIHFVIKIAIVLAVTSDQSWEFFYKHLFAFFINGMDDLIFLLTSQFSISKELGAAHTASDVFSMLNKTLALFFTAETQSKIGALFHSEGTGFVMFILLWVGMIMFLFTVFMALIKYMQAVILIALLIFLAPLFISFLLFGITKGIFDRWIKTTFGYVIQPVLLFVALSVMNAAIYSIFIEILSFPVCWKCVWWSDWFISELFGNFFGNFDLYCVSSSYTQWGGTEGQGSDPFPDEATGMFTIFIFIILCSVLNKIITFVELFATAITSGRAAPSLSSTGPAAINSLKEEAGNALSTAKNAVRSAGSIAKGIDNVTGNRISKHGKGAIRSGLGRIAGGDVMGGSDGMGGRMASSKFLMTSKEKRALRREKSYFKSLSVDDKAHYAAHKAEQIKAMDKAADAGNFGAADAIASGIREENKNAGKKSYFSPAADKKAAKEAFKKKLAKSKDATVARGGALSSPNTGSKATPTKNSGVKNGDD